MSAMYILSLSAFLIYMISIKNIFGILPSISDSYYKLKEYNFSSVFTIFCWVVSIPLMIYWIDYSSTDWNFIPFIVCASLAFVGASPAFKDLEMERKIHSISAIVCAVGAYVWSILFGSVFLSVNFILLSGILYFLIKNNKIYWLELMAFINIYLQLLITSLW